MIIDIHAHLGYDFVFDEEQNEQELLDAYNENKIDGAIIQPFICRPYIEDTINIHNRIFKLCKNYPGRFWGMISIQPHFKPEDYEKEAIRCCKKLGFVGIKITTIAHAVNPSGKDGFHVFEVAKMLNLPVMIHTGIGTPFADPMSSWKVLEAFPEVKVIIAHAGSGLMFQQAIILAQKFDNVYLETSWLPAPYVLNILKTIGASRLMFASDLSLNLPMEIMKYKMLIKKNSDYERIMAGTAKEVFNLKL